MSMQKHHNYYVNTQLRLAQKLAAKEIFSVSSQSNLSIMVHYREWVLLLKVNKEKHKINLCINS